jgi:hypothetical protein
LLVPLPDEDIIKVTVARSGPFDEFIRLINLKINLFAIVQVQVLEQICVFDDSSYIVHWVPDPKSLKSQLMLWKFFLISFESYLPQFRTSISNLNKNLADFDLCKKLGVGALIT